MSELEETIDSILESYRKDLRRSAKWSDSHTEAGMHLSKDQAKQALTLLIDGVLLPKT